jgi:sialate O-acetylesterase
MRFVSLLAAISAGLVSGLTLPAIFGNSALLQRDSPFQIWGSDTVGTTVKVVFLGSTYQSTTNAAGSWSVSLPATPATATPIDIAISSSSGATLTLSDIVFGDLFVCSGQSNMELSVADTVNTTATVAASSAYAAMLRIFQVATMPQYPNTSTPQTDLTPNIPWTRVGPNNVAGMSGFCYFFGLDALLANPSVPIGLVDSSWGGTAIESEFAAAITCSVAAIVV